MPNFFTQVSTRCGTPQDNSPHSGTALGKMVQQTGKFRICKNVTQLIFKWTNLRCASGAPSVLEAGYFSYNLKASVRYGGVNYPVVFPQGRIATVQPDEIVTSLPVNITVAAGNDIELRWYIDYAAEPAGWPFSTRYSEGWNEFGVNLTDVVDTGTTYYQQNGVPVFVLPPFQILGNTGYCKAVEIVGDSISVGGAADTYATKFGYLQRGLVDTGIPYIENGGASGTLANMLEKNYGTTAVQKARRRIAHDGDKTISHVFCGVISADLASGRTDTQILNYLSAYKTELDTQGIKLIPFTILPRTNAANTARTTSDSAQVWTYIRNVNDALRANNGVGYGVMDVNRIARDPNNIDLWRSDLGTPTADGIHPAGVIHTALAAYAGPQAAAITGLWMS